MTQAHRAGALVLLVFRLAAQAQTEALIEAGHWKRARTLVAARLREAPDDPQANFFNSQITAAFGGREAPLHFAQKAVALGDGVACYHRQLAEVDGIMAQHSNVLQQVMLARKFRKEIDRALELDTRDVQALRDLMEFYLLAPGIAGGDREQARAVATRIARINTSAGYSAEARLALFANDDSRALIMLRKSVEANPANYKARMALADYYFDRSNWVAAAATAREAILLDPARAGAYAMLAATAVRMGQLDVMESVLQQADRTVPDDLAPHYRAAEALLAAGGNASLAEKHLRIYLSAEPEGGEPTTEDAHRKLSEARARTKTERRMPN